MVRCGFGGPGFALLHALAVRIRMARIGRLLNSRTFVLKKSVVEKGLAESAVSGLGTEGL